MAKAPVPKASQEVLTILAEWEQAKTQHDHFKKLEMELRHRVVAMGFPGILTGTHRLALPAEGFFVKHVAGMETVIDRDLFAVVEPKLTSDTKAMCVKFTPSLIAAGYKVLPAGPQRDLLNEALVTKPKTPTIEIEAPKAK